MQSEIEDVGLQGSHGVRSRQWRWATRPLGVAALAAVCVLGGCQSGSSLAAGSGSVRLADGERDVSVRMPGILHVELIGNASTGFDWYLSANDPSLFEPIGAPHVTPLDPGVFGGRTITTFEFRPLRTGASSIVFEYVRPREWNEPPGKTAQINAKVEG